MFRLALIAMTGAVSLVTSGCITSAVYDEAWSAQTTLADHDCPNVDGVYQNAGEAYVADDGELERRDLSLAHLLNGGWTLEEHHASDRLGTTFHKAAKDDYRTVRLERDDDRLRVDATLADGTSRQFALPIRHPCRNSLLVLETTYGYDLFTASFARGYYGIGRAEDGSLLAYQSAIGEALAIFWISEATWIRFAQKTPPQVFQSGPRTAGMQTSSH